MSEVEFAQSGDVSIAYRVVGHGAIDLVYVQGAATHLDSLWELPAFRRYCERLGEFTIGTDLHRSDSLAIVQLLVLYHLVTARAKIALGGAEAATRL